MKANWQDILKGCLKRDRASQRNLYEAFFGYAMSIAIRYCDDRDQAVAVVHDAFLIVYRKLDKYDSSQPFKPWFRVIVVRSALDYLRKQRKHSVLVELEDHTPVHQREDTLSRIGYKELTAMVHKLTEGYRTVFNLYVIDGFKHEEIADQLGITIGTSKSNLFKARVHLRRMINESLETKSPSSPATTL